METPLRDKSEFSERQNFFNHFSLLLSELFEVFTVVEPSEQNLQAYGPKVRMLLFQACTEFEALSKSVLNAHCRKARNIRDYSTLQRPLRLSDYEVQLSRYTELKSRRPFGSWAVSSENFIEWYQTYNKTMHDRIAHFDKGNIDNLLSAISGVAVFLAAMYGIAFFKKFNGLNSEISFKDWPNFGWKEAYDGGMQFYSGNNQLQPTMTIGWKEAKYPFNDR